MDPFVIEDFVAQSYQDMLYRHIIEDMQWKYLDSVSGVEDYGSTLPDGYYLSPDQDVFFCDVVNPAGVTDEFVAGILLPMAYQAQQHLNFDSTIERIRVAMYHKSSGGIHRPHVDYYYPHHTMIYYPHDTDGDTLIYDQFVEHNLDRDYPSLFTLKSRTSPKKGRALFLDGMNYHSSSPPTEHRMRMAINFNFVPVGGGEADNQWSLLGKAY